jgi:hypothetical protein
MKKPTAMSAFLSLSFVRWEIVCCSVSADLNGSITRLVDLECAKKTVSEYCAMVTAVGTI